MSVLRRVRIERSGAPLLRIVFAAGLFAGLAACSDDSDESSSEGPATGEDAGLDGHSAGGGSAGKTPAAGSGSAGKGGSGGKGGAGGKSAAAGNGSAGKGGSGGKASAAASGSGGSGGGANQEADAGTDLEDAGASALPQQYKISFSTTECFGRCPVYSVSLDQDGNVEFEGQSNVAKEGKSTKQVAPNDAADVYEALLAASYFGFKDEYRTEEDGCERVRTDASTHKWSVARDGQTKDLSQYLGCEGVPGLDKVEAVSKLLIEKSGISDWIGSNN
jgi:hypothetical protein